MRRRDFLIGSIAAASTAACVGAHAVPRMAKLDRVGVMSGDFDSVLAETRDWSQRVPPKELDILDFPQMLADHYDIHNVEVQQFHFLSMEPSYFEKFLGRLRKAKSRMIDMPLELGTSGYNETISPCSPDPQIRAHAIELTKLWIDRAAMIECPSVMVNQGRTFGDDLTPAVDALKTLRDYGKSKNVAIIMEDRGSISVDTLVKVIKDSGIYANPDIGNFSDEASTERGLRLMYPLALTVSHVKWNPQKFDFAKVIQISKDMGFKGVYSLETRGGPEPYATIQTLLDRLLENL